MPTPRRRAPNPVWPLLPSTRGKSATTRPAKPRPASTNGQCPPDGVPD
jgi:hypothetical protein